jgi:hypothetical protein
MKRNSELAISSAKNIDIGLGEGNAVLVQLTGNSTPNGTVDFQSTIDGATYTNTPYVQVRSITAAKSVAQLSSITTTTEYVILPPVTQVRISFLANTTGTLDVVWREIDYSPPFDGAFADGDELSFGGVSTIFWETADANANYLAIEVPDGSGSVDVPVVLAGIGLDGVDLGLFNGIDQPTLGIVDANRDTALVLDFSADDAARIRTLGTTRNLTLVPTGDIVLNPSGGDIDLSNNNLDNVGHASSAWDSTSLRSAVDVFVADGVGMVIGHTALLSMDGVGSEFQLHGTATPDSNMMLSRWSANDPGPQITFGKSRATTINDWGGTDSQVHNGDSILNFTCYVDDGTTTPQRTARILCVVDDASPATDQVGTKWAISTTTTGGTETTALVIDATQDVTIPNGSIAMGVVSDPSTVTDSAHIYVKDDPAEVYVRDEAGNVTKISPHNDIGEWEFHSYNNKTGKSFRVNMEHMIRKLEDITGESFIQEDIHE